MSGPIFEAEVEPLWMALSSPNRPVRGAAIGIAGVELLERVLLGTRGRV